MKLTNKRILESYPALQQLGAIELPVRVSFDIGRILRAFHEAHELIQEQRNRLLDKHAERDGEGRRKPLVGDNVPIADVIGFNSDLQELLAIESDIDMKDVKLDQLGDIRLPPIVLAALDWLITA